LLRWWPEWRSVLVFVRPETLLRWHRQGYRYWWRRRSGGKPGRPRIPRSHIALIRRISTEHPEWGEDRIALELRLKLGVTHAASTVRRYMVRPRRPGSWRQFLEAHASSFVGIDFATQTLWNFATVYIFVIVALDTRQVLRAAVTRHPTLDWVKGELESVLRVHPQRRLVLHDNDGIYGQYGRSLVVAGRRVRSHLDLWLATVLGVVGIPTPYGAPNANAVTERFIGTLRRECLEHFIFLSERHLANVVDEFVDYFNTARPHQGIDGIPAEALQPRGPPGVAPEGARLVGRPVLGGLHHDYRLVA
jgi:transposase InsO family protein